MSFYPKNLIMHKVLYFNNQILFLSALLLFIQPGYSNEADNFTQREKYIQKLQDSDTLINQEVEKRFNEVLTDNPDCNNKNLSSSSRDLINGLHAKLTSSTARPILRNGGIESFANQKFQEPAKYRYDIEASDSIFQDSLIFRHWGIASNIKISGVYIGTDKLDHLFNNGFDLYLNRNSNTDYLLKQAINDEGKFFGVQTSGVLSYADISANWKGMQFWEDVWRSEDPYFKCVNNKWQRTGRKFLIGDYVTPAMDEAINCSEYVGSRAISAGKRAEKYNCPVDPAACYCLTRNMNENTKKYLISPKCSKVRFNQQVNCARYNGLGTSEELKALKYQKSPPGSGAQPQTQTQQKPTSR